MSALAWATDWMLEGTCRQVDPDLWHPEKGGNRHSAKARRICAVCPVLAECRTYALDHPELEGIWGGMTGRERRNWRTAHDPILQAVRAERGKP